MVIQIIHQNFNRSLIKIEAHSVDRVHLYYFLLEKDHVYIHPDDRKIMMGGLIDYNDITHIDTLIDEIKNYIIVKIVYNDEVFIKDIHHINITYNPQGEAAGVLERGFKKLGW